MPFESIQKVNCLLLLGIIFSFGNESIEILYYWCVNKLRLFIKHLSFVHIGKRYMWSPQYVLYTAQCTQIKPDRSHARTHTYHFKWGNLMAANTRAHEKNFHAELLKPRMTHGFEPNKHNKYVSICSAIIPIWIWVCRTVR